MNYLIALVHKYLNNTNFVIYFEPLYFFSYCFIFFTKVNEIWFFIQIYAKNTEIRRKHIKVYNMIITSKLH